VLEQWIEEARRVLFVPTAGDRLGTLFDDASVRLSELTDKTTAAYERIDSILAEQNQKLRAAVSEFSQRRRFIRPGARHPAVNAMQLDATETCKECGTPSSPGQQVSQL
jgi:hypothetical protein